MEFSKELRIRKSVGVFFFPFNINEAGADVNPVQVQVKSVPALSPEDTIQSAVWLPEVKSCGKISQQDHFSLSISVKSAFTVHFVLKKKK